MMENFLGISVGNRCVAGFIAGYLKIEGLLLLFVVLPNRKKLPKKQDVKESGCREFTCRERKIA